MTRATVIHSQFEAGEMTPSPKPNGGNQAAITLVEFIDRAVKASQDATLAEVARLRDVLETRMSGVKEASEEQVHETRHRMEDFTKSMDMIRDAVGSRAAGMEVKELELRISAIELRGSAQAQEALAEAKVLEQRMNALERVTATTNAVEENNRRIHSSESKVRWLTIGNAISLLGVIAGAIVAFLEYTKH